MKSAINRLAPHQHSLYSVMVKAHLINGLNGFKRARMQDMGELLWKPNPRLYRIGQSVDQVEMPLMCGRFATPKVPRFSAKNEVPKWCEQ